LFRQGQGLAGWRRLKHNLTSGLVLGNTAIYNYP
jgi:hypothetical protein